MTFLRDEDNFRVKFGNKVEDKFGDIFGDIFKYNFV